MSGFVDFAYLQGNISLSIIYASNGEIGLNGTWTNKTFSSYVFNLRYFRKIIIAF